MIPPIFFIESLLSFLHASLQFFNYFEVVEDNSNDILRMSFVHLFQIIVIFNSFMEIYWEHFFDYNCEWDAHKIITYLLGYRFTF